MNKNKVIRVSIIASSSIIVIFISFMLGIYVGWTKIGKGTEEIKSLFALASYEQYIALRYKNADYDEAKKAILDLLKLMEDLKNEGNVYYNERTYRFNSLIANARLALLEERQGNEVESVKYWEESEILCMKSKWQDCSRDYIKNIINRMDMKLEE